MDPRLLAPIASAHALLDRDNPAGALRILEPLLPKHPRAGPLRVLHAVCLLRLRRPDARPALHALAASAATLALDEESASLLVGAMREGGAADMLGEVGAALLPVLPASLTPPSALFLAAIWARNPLAQQQHALSLARRSRSPAHLSWAAAAAALDPSPALPDLPLRLLDQAARDAPPSPEAVRLRIDVLLRLGRAEAALQALADPLWGGALPQPLDRLELALRAAPPALAGPLLAHLLACHDPDQWAWWEALLALPSPLPATSLPLPDGPLPLPALDTPALLSALRLAHPALRGPALAALRRAHAASDPALPELLAAYVRQFGERPVCGLDILPLAAPALAPALQPLLPTFPLACAPFLLAASPLPDPSLAPQLLSLYRSAPSPPPEEWADADRLLETAAMALVLQDRPAEAAACLLVGLARSESAFMLRARLGRVLMRSGAVREGEEVLRGLGLKHVQWESLAHLFADDLLASPLPRQAQSLIDAVLAFHADHDRVHGDLLYTAYQQGALSKVAELSRFSSRCMASPVRAQAFTESVLLPLRTGLPSLSRTFALLRTRSLTPIDPETLISNDDTTVILNGPVQRVEALRRYFLPDDMLIDRPRLVQLRRLCALLLRQCAESMCLVPSLKKTLGKDTPTLEASACKDGMISLLREMEECLAAIDLSEEIKNIYRISVATFRLHIAVLDHLPLGTPAPEALISAVTDFIDNTNGLVQSVVESIGTLSPLAMKNAVRLCEQLKWTAVVAQIWGGMNPSPKTKAKVRPATVFTPVKDLLVNSFAKLASTTKAYEATMPEYLSSLCPSEVSIFASTQGLEDMETFCSTAKDKICSGVKLNVEQLLYWVVDCKKDCEIMAL